MVIFPTLPDLILCYNFSIFFQDKVSNIISKIKLITNNVSFIPLCYDILLGCGVYFDSFYSTSFSEVLDLILASKSSSPIDPFPLSLFNKLAFILTPFILNIINMNIQRDMSLHSGIIPSSLKHIIKPILKKPELDIECLSNYRPISQLPFISKILEG